MALRLCPALRQCFVPPLHSNKSVRFRKFSVHNHLSGPNESHKLVMEVKEKLEKDHYNLPVGRNGRDDEDMILWFLKDRKFSVDDAVSKLTKAIKWRQEFGVSELSEELVKSVAETGKAYVHDSLDVFDRPMQDSSENEKLCVFLIEKALSRLPDGRDEILGIFDLQGFKTKNADLKFLTFLFDVLYYYYPKRVGEVLFVEAPFVFKPIWQLVKPLLKSYASLLIQSHADIGQPKGKILLSWRPSRKSILQKQQFQPSFRD
ncbi:hypothetical protein F0562_024286 [Nyssa sinensis]|uniref:CRAL-TRIO domain-containing protein n=1 Tax=Nyssa sinensis TaxID=561372 RepID=A0A5J5BC83_9ASTE|nr:hypothetical protein F0562_024286 [Nyssa sinensis]